MKKIILILVLLLNIQCCFAGNCENWSCHSSYDLTSGVSRFFSVATGQNFIAERVFETVIKNALKKEISSGKIDVNLDSFSTRDLKAGRFKSLEITGKDINIDGIYLSYFNSKTLCNFNYVSHDGNYRNFTVRENIPAEFSAVITEDDLNNTLNSADYKRLIKDINCITGGLGLFEITSVNVELKNGKMYYIMRYAVPFMRKPKAIKFCTDISAENGRISMSNTNLLSDNSFYSIESLSSIINYLNPLDFSAKILENKHAKFDVNSIAIKDKQININGIMTVLKDKE